jgi:ATP-dependent RNA helicase DHX8/PRP22
MEKPDNDAILQAFKQLYFLDAVAEDGHITELGNEMCRFPLEPSYSKALIAAMLMDCEEEMTTVVSLLSSENLWSKPSRVKEEEFAYFETLQREQADLQGDHQTMLSRCTGGGRGRA